MSRPTINVLSSLRPTTILRSLPSAAVQPVASSSTSHFSTSSPNHASRSKQVAKRKKSQVLALRASRQAEDAHPPDPILGHIPTDSSTGRSSASAASIDGHGGVTSASASAGGRSRNTWEGCRLQRTILTPTDVWSAPYNTTPQHYLPGLSAEDRDLLFGAVPHTTLTLGTRDVSDEARSMRGTEEQERQTGAMMKILDLRNSSKKGIEVVNRQRIIEEFGRTRVMGEDGQVRFEGEPQSGGSEVQAALLTQKIRNLHQHNTQNPRDIHNKRPLRTLVHQRAKILKYLKRSQPGDYDHVLKDLGLERRAVEGELIV